MERAKKTGAKDGVPPVTRGQVEEGFRRLRIPATTYGTLWEWGATPAMVRPVVRFLERLRFWQGRASGRRTAS